MELNNMKKIINTPEGIIEVDLTAEEIAQREQDAIQAEQYRIAFEAEKQAKANAKASALAKLKALGLTEEEVKSIL
jgi:uncharacterized protein (AIM24 family)